MPREDPGEGFSLAEATHAAIMNPPSDPIRHSAIREEQGLIKYLQPEQLEEASS